MKPNPRGGRNEGVLTGEKKADQGFPYRAKRKWLITHKLVHWGKKKIAQWTCRQKSTHKRGGPSRHDKRAVWNNQPKVAKKGANTKKRENRRG